MYEHGRQALLTRQEFVPRAIGHFFVALAILVLGIAVGMTGFHHYEHYSWTDAFLNTCMLLGGMGQVNPILTEAGKIFAGFFALGAGVGFIAIATIIVAPWAHRLLHLLHLESQR